MWIGQAAQRIGQQRLGGPGAKAFARRGPRQLEEQHGSGDRGAGVFTMLSLLDGTGHWPRKKCVDRSKMKSKI